MKKGIIAIVLALLIAGVTVWFARPGLRSVSGPPLVAVIDTGVNAEAEGVAGRVADGARNVLMDSDDAADVDGHGTEIARIILSECPECRVLPIKITEHGGAIRAEDIEEAVRYALERGATVMNFSFGITRPDPTRMASLKNLFQEAVAKGAIPVVAAGVGIPNPFRPAEFSTLVPQSLTDTIVVGVTESGERPDPTQNRGDELDVVVLQTRPAEGQAGNYGSSYAAAQVSGVLAQWIASHGGGDFSSSLHRVRAASLKPAEFRPDRFGFGVLNLSVEKLPAAEAQPVAFRTYPSDAPAGGVTVDISAAKPIGKIDAKWECETEAESPTAKAFGKARARITAASVPDACPIRVAIGFADGEQENLTIPPLPRPRDP